MTLDIMASCKCAGSIGKFVEDQDEGLHVEGLVDFLEDFRIGIGEKALHVILVGNAVG